MFEKANPIPAARRAGTGHHRPDELASARALPWQGENARYEARPNRRTGEALRAVEWSEITARLNAARDLRLLLRLEAQAPIAPEAASFGDAAASYFALLDNCEWDVNPDALGQSKVLDAMTGHYDANRDGTQTGASPDAAHGDARERK